MIYNELISESKKTPWNTLVSILNHLFGFKKTGNAKIRRVRQSFDQKRGEHVILLEYRVRASNQSPIKVKPKKLVKPDKKDKK